MLIVKSFRICCLEDKLWHHFLVRVHQGNFSIRHYQSFGGKLDPRAKGRIYLWANKSSDDSIFSVGKSHQKALRKISIPSKPWPGKIR